MNKLVWVIISLIVVIILGSIGVWAYAKGYQIKITKPESTTTSSQSTPSTSTSEETSTAKTVKDVHCLQNPTKGDQIVISNLTDYQTASSPLTFSGTANAFEGEFLYKLRDCRGPVIDEGTVSVEGEVGTNPAYTKTITFTLSRDPLDAVLEVYEVSAEDGTEINLYQLPLRLTK